MCRADVADAAAGPLSRLLTDMAAALAEQVGARVEDVTIGPVDFGPEPN